MRAVGLFVLAMLAAALSGRAGASGPRMRGSGGVLRRSVPLLTRVWPGDTIVVTERWF